MVSLTLIGKGVSRIGRVLLDSVLAWALLWFPGRAGNRDRSPWVQLMQNSFLLALHPGKPHGFGSCSLIHFDSSLEPVVIRCDNQSCIKYQRLLCFTTVFETHGDEISLVCDMVRRRAISLRYIPTDEQTADVLTKPLSNTKFDYFRDKLGVVENAPLAERES